MSALRKRSQRGYTVVEVLAAMTLFTIGAAGVISMERVTIQGGDDARHFDIATNIANQWAARLQRDAMFWTAPNSFDATSNINQTLWVKDVGMDWHVPAVPPTGGASSPAYDLIGREIPPDGSDAIFCTQFRSTWIVPTPALGAFMRTEIRVVWGRLESPIVGNCKAMDAVDLVANKDRYHFVYVTTALRENRLK